MFGLELVKANFLELERKNHAIGVKLGEFQATIDILVEDYSMHISFPFSINLECPPRGFIVLARVWHLERFMRKEAYVLVDRSSHVASYPINYLYR